MLHTAYFVALQKGYRISDLSLVYPLARGTGPLLATAVAVVALGERPSGLAVGGALLIGIGAMTLANVPKGSDAVAGITFALITGALIATYTLWDKYAVSDLDIPPVVYDWANNSVRSLILVPLLVLRRNEVGSIWRTNRGRVVAVAVLAPFAYILVLTALAFSPVSYVAPAREISIVVGTLLGTHVLAETDARRRLVASAAIVVGLVALSVG